MSALCVFLWILAALFTGAALAECAVLGRHELKRLLQEIDR